MSKLTRTATPGIFRRHRKGCNRRPNCGCRYAVVWRHRGRQSMQTFDTLGAAREAKGRRQAGDRRPASKERFEDYARHWLEDYARHWLGGYRGRTSRGFSESTRQIYGRDLENWTIPYFGGCRLADVEPPDVRAFVTHLDEAGLRASTIRSVMAPVKAMFATAVEDGALRTNPTANVRIGLRRSIEPSREIRAMTRAELSEVLGRIPQESRLIFELLAHTGLRISEAVGLTWSDLELGAKPRMAVRRQDYRGEVGPLKTAASRRDIPLSPVMAGRLATARGSRPDCARVFTSPEGRRLNDGNLRRRVLVPAAEAAGVPWVTFHAFRHTCASLLFEAGRDVKQVSAWLGHADAGFTLRVYVHLMDEGVGSAAFLDEVVVAAPPTDPTGEPGATDPSAEKEGSADSSRRGRFMGRRSFNLEHVGSEFIGRTT
jgi:integrase